MHSRWTARQTRRCSARFTCSYDRQSFQERFVPRRSCHRRANSQLNSVFRGLRSSRLSNSFSPKDTPPAGRAQGPTSRPIFPNPSGQLMAARSDRYPAARTAAPSRELGDFVDVTAQSDERPFNLGRTLVDARTAELWRKLSARSLRSFGRHHLGYGDPQRHAGTAQVGLRLSPGRARRAVRARTGRDHRGHAASPRYR